MYMQGKREREHTLGLGHTMEDGGCPVEVMFLAWENMGSGVGALLK